MGHKAIEVVPSTTLVSSTLTSGEQRTPDGKGLILGVKVADLVTTPTFTPKIQTKGASGTWIDYWTAAAAISTNSDHIYLLYPSLTLGGDAEEKVNLPCPFAWRVVVTFGGTGTATVEVDAQVLT